MNNKSLSDEHLKQLQNSVINDDVIRARGYRTITEAKELEQYGFAHSQRRAPGLLIPLWTTEGHNSLYVYRPDNPRVIENKKKKNPDGTHPQKVLKYEYPKGAPTHLDCPPICQPTLGDPSVELWITEGQKKADSLVSQGLCAIALLGVWNWRGTNQSGGTTALPDWEYVALNNNRRVNIVFDSDVIEKPEVQQALTRLMNLLQSKGASVRAVYLPADTRLKKTGVDDWLAAGHTVEELKALVEAPRQEPKPATPEIELLPNPPEMITRPLTLLGKHAYAASWLYVKVTRRESVEKGEIIRHDPPIIINERRLFIVRNDGVIFGDGAQQSLKELEIDIHLSEIPPTDKTWGATSVTEFANGQRPDISEVFCRMVDVIDRFIDFDRSLADQRTMSEMAACFILSTWFLDAFNVVGFLWPNGDRGCGKTHLLLVVSELAYLGQMILAGGSYATLRDMADYGACLAFDDAENIADPKHTDPDKRTLLLAGNRRGAQVTIKELGPDKKWKTRYINAFCPRLFSAIRLPDYVLASRTIIIPLIRTPDRKRANSDPLDYDLWPHNHKDLIDDLWAIALHHLPDLPDYDKWVGAEAQLAGRNLQPWRAILAVAKLLDDNGVEGLWKRIETISVNYQHERPQLETSDLTLLVLRALLECAAQKISSNKTESNQAIFLETASVTTLANQIAKNEDIPAINPESEITTRKVGIVLGKQRFKKARESRTGPRGWKVSKEDLIRCAIAYGFPIPGPLNDGFESSIKAEINNTGTLYINGANGVKGANGAKSEDNLCEGVI